MTQPTQQLPSQFAFIPCIAAIEFGKAKDMPMTRAELQGLAMVIGAEPPAIRVHSKAGKRLDRVIDRVIEVDDKLEQLVEEGEIDAGQSGRFREMALLVKALVAREGGALPPAEERAKGFEYLWSDAFENDDQWLAARRAGRAAFTALRAEDDPWLG